MDLFGRQGFHATTITQIERAAGLSPGAGGLYRHFTSKRSLLEEGLRRQVSAGPDIEPGDAYAQVSALPLREQLMIMARAGLRRLANERDLNRLLVRDLASFPELLALVRDAELRSVHARLQAWLTATRPDVEDPPALAAVLMGAISHYWIMTDVFGEHPLGIDEDRYLTRLVELTTALLGED